MTLSNELAQRFDKDALTQLADHAARCARIMLDDEPKVWRMTDDERAALDTFRQFACYARRIINMVE